MPAESLIWHREEFGALAGRSNTRVTQPLGRVKEKKKKPKVCVEKEVGQQEMGLEGLVDEDRLSLDNCGTWWLQAAWERWPCSAGLG